MIRSIHACIHTHTHAQKEETALIDMIGSNSMNDREPMSKGGFQGDGRSQLSERLMQEDDDDEEYDDDEDDADLDDEDDLEYDDKRLPPFGGQAMSFASAGRASGTSTLAATQGAQRTATATKSDLTSILYMDDDEFDRIYAPVCFLPACVKFRLFKDGISRELINSCFFF
jgi:hypothetical protein